MILCFDEYELDPQRLELRRAGLPMRADAVVVRLLSALVLDAGRLVTKQELISRVWSDRAVSDNVVTVAMTRLRKTLGHKPGEREFIVNLQGRGYRFVRPVAKLDHALAPVVDATPRATRAHLPFVGRARTMERLQRALDEARGGGGGVCLLTGEPGIGKTRVVEQLTTIASGLGCAVAWGQCQEVGDTPPLWPVAQLVRALAATASAMTGAPPDDAPELRWLLDDHGGRESEGRPLAKHRVFEALLSVVERTAARRPCMLVLDDLHRADAASLELLRYWIDGIARTPVLLVATMRSVRSLRSVARADLSYVVGHRNCERIELERLEPTVVEDYVGAVVRDPDRSLGHAVWSKSEGNPFFMVELARQLADAAVPDARSLTVPEQAIELVRPRILELDVAARGVLSAAAVIGRRFDLTVLAQVADCEQRALMASLDHAIATGVIVRATDASTIFVFGHELIRQLLYRELDAGARRRCHRRVGEVLEDARRHGRGDTAAVLAYHFHAGLPESDPDKAVAYCEQAANDAAIVFAYADGARYLRHAREALQLTDAASPTRAMLLLLRQAVFARISGSPEFVALARALTELSQQHASGPFMVHAGLLLDLHPGFPALPHARGILESALTLLTPDEVAFRGTALARLATSGASAFNAALANAQVAEALAIGEASGSLIAIYGARIAELYLVSGPDQDDAAHRAERALEQLCQANPLVLTAPPVLLELHRAIVALQRGQIVATTAALDRAATLCRKLGSRELMWHVERFQVLSSLATSAIGAHAATLRALHARARTESVVASELLCLFDEVVVLGDTVSPAALRRVMATSTDDPPNIWSLKVRALAAAGLFDDARLALAAHDLGALAMLPRDRDHLGTLGSLARAALAVRSHAHMAALYDLLAPHGDRFAIHVGFVCEGPIAVLLGELASGLDRADEAASHFETAIAVSERLGLFGHAAGLRRSLASGGARAKHADG